MVLVGYRVNDTYDGYNFLLQNWWPRMQFLEVTDEFLKASQVHVVYVTKLVRTFDPDYSRISMYV